jgi:hypothetical protein
MDVDVKLIWLFLIGTFLAFLFYVEEMITENTLVEKLGVVKATLLVFINSVIGGVVMVTVYYAMVQFCSDWHEYLKVGIAGTTAMLGKDMIRLYYKFVAIRVEK